MQRQNHDKKRVVLGITGSFGSGKSSVARIFASSRAKLIDADKIAHSVVRPGTKAYNKICNTFGKGVLSGNKAVNRRKLAGIVFNNKNLLKKLNSIVHPEVILAIKSEIKKAKSRIVVLDAPLLIEAGIGKIADKLIVVTISKEKQAERIQKRTSIAKKDIEKRIKAQIPLRIKARLADFIIDNNGTFEETKKQVKKICEKLGLSQTTKIKNVVGDPYLPAGRNCPRKYVAH